MGKKKTSFFVDQKSDFCFNACVGTNTGSSDNSIDYSHGFKTATEVMLKQLGVDRPSKADDNWGKYPNADILVYPICYSARHHLELTLKRFLPMAQKILKIKAQEKLPSLAKPHKVELTHDISKIWSVLSSICNEIADSRLILKVKDIEPGIQKIDEIDSSGQVFRYPSSGKDRKLNLKEISRINLQDFAEWYAEQCKLLKELENLFESLDSEYSTGSFTRKLSRNQLVEIAEKLPPRDQWESALFDEARKSIIKDYALSSKEFQRACEVIQEKRGLAQYVDILIPIEGLKNDTFARLYQASKGCGTALQSLDLRERSIIYALLNIGKIPYEYLESFEWLVRPRPTDEEAAHQFDLEREPVSLARKVLQRPDVVQHSLKRLGQLDMCTEFCRIFGEKIGNLSMPLDKSRNIDLDEMFLPCSFSPAEASSKSGGNDQDKYADPDCAASILAPGHAASPENDDGIWA